MENKSLFFRNVYRVLSDAALIPLENVDVVVKDNLIEAIEKTGVLQPDEQSRVIDCSSLVMLAGLVNTHHHFYQTLTRNHPAVQNAELFDWLTFLYDVWKYIDEDALYYSSLLAMGELLKTGCTTTTDHHYIYPKNVSGDLMALQFAASDKLGIRFSPTRGSMSLSKKDGGLPPDSVVQTHDEILKASEDVIHRFHDPSDFAMRKIVLAPCSPFSVTKNLMRDSALLARQHGVYLHTHLAETRDENDFCIEMYGKRPLELMQECGFIGNDVFYAHGIHFNDDELKILKETNSHIAHCPSSNMRLGSGICRVKEMLELGINVGIGVDGSASNDSSDMLGEVRNALLLQRVENGAAALTASQAFQMATENGAKMLNFGKIGKIKKGWAADFALFDINSLSYTGSLSDPVAALIFCGSNHNATYTVVNGKIVVDKGVLVGFDEDEIIKKANKISFSMLEKAANKEVV
jgi:cytosine/adenosine deaminase-related metal-dependent hydrolase